MAPVKVTTEEILEQLIYRCQKMLKVVELRAHLDLAEHEVKKEQKSREQMSEKLNYLLHETEELKATAASMRSDLFREEVSHLAKKLTLLTKDMKLLAFSQPIEFELKVPTGSTYLEEFLKLGTKNWKRTPLHSFDGGPKPDVRVWIRNFKAHLRTWCPPPSEDEALECLVQHLTGDAAQYWLGLFPVYRYNFYNCLGVLKFNFTKQSMKISECHYEPGERFGGFAARLRAAIEYDHEEDLLHEPEDSLFKHYLRRLPESVRYLVEAEQPATLYDAIAKATDLQHKHERSWNAVVDLASSVQNLRCFWSERDKQMKLEREKELQRLQQQKEKKQQKRKPMRNSKCYYCEKMGHFARDCWEKKNDLKLMEENKQRFIRSRRRHD